MTSCESRGLLRALPRPLGRNAAKTPRAGVHAATEVMLWQLLRRDVGLSRKETEAVLLALVLGLVMQSQKKEG